MNGGMMKRSPLQVGEKCRTDVMRRGDKRIWTIVATGHDKSFGTGTWIDAKCEDGKHTGRADAPWFTRIPQPTRREAKAD